MPCNDIKLTDTSKETDGTCQFEDRSRTIVVGERIWKTSDVMSLMLSVVVVKKAGAL